MARNAAAAACGHGLRNRIFGTKLSATASGPIGWMSIVSIVALVSVNALLTLTEIAFSFVLRRTASSGEACFGSPHMCQNSYCPGLIR